MKIICGYCQFYSYVCTLCKKYNIYHPWTIACAGYRLHPAYKII